MTQEQLAHYLKGGKFTATYRPTKLDIALESQAQIGRTITVYQNCLISPIQEEAYKGQFRFNSPSIYGWFPGEDIQDLTIINDYVDFPEKVEVQHCYKMTFTEEKKLQPNFGWSDYPRQLPFVVHREYSSDMDNYVINELCNPRADKVEKRIVDLLNGVETEWEVIYEDQPKQAIIK